MLAPRLLSRSSEATSLPPIRQHINEFFTSPSERVARIVKMNDDLEALLDELRLL